MKQDLHGSDALAGRSLADMAGWHGKLPALGDFASRRLPPAFVEPWDAWLSGGLQWLREDAPDTWLAAYLDSPVWRFVLMPGVLSPAPTDPGWAGVLMPSVDRVGRYFPLTIAQPLVAPHSVASPALWHWLACLDDLAAAALHGDWDIERLERELARLPQPDAEVAAPMPADAPGSLVCVGGQVPADALGGASEPNPDPAATIAVTAMGATDWQGLCWWHAEPADADRRLLISRGLPAAPAFAQLFGELTTPSRK